MGRGEIVAPAASQEVEIPGADSDRPCAAHFCHYASGGKELTSADLRTLTPALIPRSNLAETKLLIVVREKNSCRQPDTHPSGGSGKRKYPG